MFHNVPRNALSNREGAAEQKRAHPESSPALLAPSVPCAAAFALGLAEYAELLSSLKLVLAREKNSLFSEDAAADTCTRRLAS